MNKVTQRGILATKVLEQYKTVLQDEEAQEVLGEIKPSRISTRRQQEHKHEERRKKNRFHDWDD